MNVTMLKALVLFGLAFLLAWSAVVCLRTRTFGSVVQLIGALGLLIVVLTHVAEALHVFQAMQWRDEHSAGHYLDLFSAVLAVTLLPLGYVMRIGAKKFGRGN